MSRAKSDERSNYGTLGETAAIVLTLWRLPIAMYDVCSCVLVARERVHRPPLRTFLTAIPVLFKQSPAAERGRVLPVTSSPTWLSSPS